MKLFPSLQISQKLPLALVGSAIVVAAGVGITSYIIASSALEQQARQNLDTIAFERANELSVYMQGIETDLIKTARSDNAQYALSGFAKAWHGLDNPALASDASKVLQAAFLTGDADKRIDLEKIDGLTPAYNVNHTHYQPIYREQIQTQGYHDLYPVSTPPATSSTRPASRTISPPLSPTAAAANMPTVGSAASIARAMDKTPAGSFAFADLAPYAADGGAPLAFFAAPMVDPTNVKIGVVAISVAPDVIGKVVSYRQGLGATGDTIIVGVDGLARLRLRVHQGRRRPQADDLRQRDQGRGDRRAGGHGGRQFPWRRCDRRRGARRCHRRPELGPRGGDGQVRDLRAGRGADHADAGDRRVLLLWWSRSSAGCLRARSASR